MKPVKSITQRSHRYRTDRSHRNQLLGVVIWWRWFNHNTPSQKQMD